MSARPRPGSVWLRLRGGALSPEPYRVIRSLGAEPDVIRAESLVRFSRYHTSAESFARDFAPFPAPDLLAWKERLDP